MTKPTASARQAFRASLGTTTSLGGFAGAVADEEGDKNEGISDSDKKMDALCDMIRDACAKFDSVSERMDRMDARMDAAAKADEDEDEKKADADEEEEKKADAEEKEEAKADAEEEEKKEEAKADAEEEKEEVKADAMADDAPISVAEARALRAQISALQARTPALLTASDRERYASIQEAAEPAFQAFGDRAPGPLDGESPTSYKRRLAEKLKMHSPKWAETRLSGIADEAVLDVVVGDIYADSIAAARKGSEVPAGQLRQVTRSSGGHTIIEWEGSPDAWMNGFAGNAMRGSGGWNLPH